MKDRSARALAIVALVFMAIFVGFLITTIVDHTLLNGAVGFIALGAGVMVIIMFLALKADGRGFSITKMNNEIELQKIEKELAEKRAAKEAEQNKTDDDGDPDGGKPLKKIPTEDSEESDGV